MTHAPHSPQGDSVQRQRHGGFLAYVSSLFDRGVKLVAGIVHQSILPLQHSPIAPLLWHDDCSYPHEYACKSGICGPLYSEHSYTVILDLDATRLGTGERVVHPTAVPADLQKYSAWTSSGETDDDGK